MAVTLTNHGDLRIKQRVGIKSKQRREDWANEAYTHGKRENECVGIEKKVLQSLTLTPSEEGGQLEKVLYQDRICIFNEGTLITVYPRDPETARIMEHRRAYNRGVRHVRITDGCDFVAC